jgi:hypothetical protein
MKREYSPLIPAALAAILLLGACGSDQSATGDTVSSVSDDDGTDDGSTGTGMLAPRPIEITSGNGVATSATAETADSRISTDMSYMPTFIADYIIGDGMPALPTNDVGYWFESGIPISADEVAALAAVFGVTGEPERIDEGYGVRWQVGPADGTAPAFTIYEDAQHSWSYSIDWARQSVAVGSSCGVATVETGSVGAGTVEPDGTVTTEAAPPEFSAPECSVPEPPTGILTKDQVEARVSELLVAAGEDPASYTFESYADEWFASTSAAQQINGTAAGKRLDVGFGAEGVMQYASGTLAAPVEVGPYPLIDIDTAIARLKDQNWFYGGGGVMRDGGIASPAIAEAPVAVDMVEADPAIGAMPIDGTVPEPQPIVVTLVDVQADVWWAWDVDGSMWLLPAYRFIDTDGGWHVVPAVTDEFLIQVEPEVVTGEPGVVTGEPGVPPVEPMPGDTVPLDDPTQPPTDPALFDSSVLEPFVGLTLKEFTDEAEALGASVRVVEQDGVALAVTEDFGFSRVNVAVDGEIVTRIVNVG